MGNIEGSTITFTTITPKELFELHQSGRSVELIDVRTPAEYREVHATIARSVPLDSLNPAAVLENRSNKDQPLYVICKSGKRGEKACEKLLASGGNVVNVVGGTSAWEQAGLPVVRGKKTISLERQVRIVAGVMALLGSILAAVVSPWWLILPGMVGAGMLHAGITDSCAMGMLLAKMPWNKVSLEGQTCSA